MSVYPQHPKNGTEEAGLPSRPGFLRSQMENRSGNTDFGRNNPSRLQARVTLAFGSLRWRRRQDPAAMRLLHSIATERRDAFLSA